MSESDADVQALLKEIMPVTKQGLEERAGFVPVGAVVAPDGMVRRIESIPEAEAAAMPMKEAVGVMREQLRRAVAGGTARSAAVAADVMICRRADGDEASSAVSVHVENQAGYCVDLLIPYKVRRGMMSRLRKKPQVMFRKMIAQQSDPVIFLRADALKPDMANSVESSG